MHLGLSFSTLLAGVLFVISFQNVAVDARPVHAPRGVTLPLRRIVSSRTNLHPQILLQQRINRGRKRLARMSGRSIPTDEELGGNLVKRVLAVEGQQGLMKRYNRHGVPKQEDVTRTGQNKGGNTAQLKKNGKVKSVSSFGKEKNGGGGKGAKKVAAGGAAGAAAGVSASAGGTASTPISDSTEIGGPDAAIDVTEADAPATADSLGLNIEDQDVGYLATIQMGTPPRAFSILMDSGSADLWVGSENCESLDGGGCGNHQFLGEQSSSSFQDTAQPFNVTYGTGQVGGDIVTDNISIANLNLVAHTFGVATTESVDFSSDTTPFDGLMGLAQSSLSQQNTLTPIEALAQQGLVPAAIVGYKISRLADNKNDGEITFGSEDQTKFDPTTQVTLANVNQQGFWEAAMDAVSVDGVDTGLTGRTAILDTGTTLIVAPTADAEAVHQNIDGAKSDGQGGFTVPCNTNASVALTFGGSAFAIDSRDLATQPVSANDPNGDCVSGITAGNIGGAQEWLVGDVFLKNAYFSTDVGQNTLSLAQLL